MIPPGEKDILRGMIKSLQVTIEYGVKDTMLVTYDLDLSQRFNHIYNELESILEIVDDINI